MAAVRGPRAREERERELVAATRALFDERGVQDAPVEEIARAVGIARGLIYRHFSSKEELYVVTMVDYLGELAGELQGAVAERPDPVHRAACLMERYAGFCLRYPAFLDCSLSLMHRPAGELRQMVSESVWVRLGQGMAVCLGVVADTLREGKAAGAFVLEDPDLMANVLWTQTLGAMHLCRLGVGVTRTGAGAPDLFGVDDAEVVRQCVASALATLGVTGR